MIHITKTIVSLLLPFSALFLSSPLLGDEAVAEPAAAGSPSVAPSLIPSYESTLLKMLLTLGGLLVVVMVTVWVLKRFFQGRMGGFGSQKKIAILERKHISPKTALYVIELEGKKVLVSESQLEIKLLKLSGDSDLYE
jgi:hypothetical protein